MVRIGFRAQPYKRSELLSVVDDTLALMRLTGGCSGARLYMDHDDANAFTLVVEWDSRDAVEAFFESRPFHLFQGVRMLMWGEPLIVIDEVRSRVATTVES